MSDLKRRPTRTFRCTDCGVLFKRRADHVPRTADGLVRCTRCARRVGSPAGREYPARRTGHGVVCVVCGRSFYRSASQLVTVRPTCSVTCRAKDRTGQERPEMHGRTMNAGQANGQYKHGKFVGQKTQPTQKRHTRAAVRARDGDRCLMCHRSGPGLHLHRVVYGSQGGKYEPGNCVLLCPADHRRVHSSKVTWMPGLVEHLRLTAPLARE